MSMAAPDTFAPGHPAPGSSDQSLRLRVVTMRGIELDLLVERLGAESLDGAFTLLPRHLDLVAPLVTGLLRYRGGDDDGAAEHAIAVDGGTLVKQGTEVIVATRWMVRADSTAELERAWRAMTSDRDARERASRVALGRLERDLVARLIETGTER